MFYLGNIDNVGNIMVLIYMIEKDHVYFHQSPPLISLGWGYNEEGE